MGFFTGLGRLIAGKPVFQDEQNTAQTTPQIPQSSVAPQHTFVDERGYKIIPKIELSHVTTHPFGGDKITITAWATNTSNEAIRLDYVTALSQKSTVMRELTPGASHEIELYRGQAPMDENNSRVELVFRIMANGDLFDNIYFAEFTRQSTGQFFMDELHENGPTRDI